MNERELINEITHTRLKDIIEWSLTHQVQTVPHTKGLYDNLIPFLIMKCHLEDLLNTVITPTSNTIPIKLDIDCEISRDNQEKLAMYVNENVYQQFYDKYTYSGNLMMDIKAYNEKQLNDLFPKLIENFPFIVITAILRHSDNLKDEMKEAIDTYINTYYIEPLKEKVPGIECDYDTTYSLVTFRVNTSQCPNVRKFIRSAYTSNYNIVINYY